MQAWKNIQKVFLHVQAAFCHASLGTKVHLNVKGPHLFEGLHTEFSKNWDVYYNDVAKPIIEPKVKSLMEEDETLNLMVMLTDGSSSGVVYSGSELCHSDKRRRYSMNECGGTDNLHGMLKCVAVSNQTHLHSLLYDVFTLYADCQKYSLHRAADSIKHIFYSKECFNSVATVFTYLGELFTTLY